MITTVKSLDTIGKLKEINGYVISALDKLPSIRNDLVRVGKDRPEWKLEQFADALKLWKERNPISHERKPLESRKRDKLFSTKQSRIKAKKMFIL